MRTLALRAPQTRRVTFALVAGFAAHLAIFTGSVERAFLLGLAPFAGLDIVKAVIAAALAPNGESGAGA